MLRIQFRRRAFYLIQITTFTSDDICEVVDKIYGGRALDDSHRARARTINQTPNTIYAFQAVRLRGLSFVVERETAQIVV